MTEAVETIEEEPKLDLIHKNDFLTDEERLENQEVLNSIKRFYNNNTENNFNDIKKAFKNFHPLVLIKTSTIMSEDTDVTDSLDMNTSDNLVSTKTHDIDEMVKMKTLNNAPSFFIFSREDHVNFMLERRYVTEDNMDNEAIVKLTSEELFELYQTLHKKDSKTNIVFDWEYLNLALDNNFINKLYEVENKKSETDTKKEETSNNDVQEELTPPKKKFMGLF